VRWAIPLLILAVLASAWLAYGTNPAFAQEFGGLSLITLTRRVQWLLLIAAIVPSLALIIIVSINRASAGWLLGLSIVVGLFFVRFNSVSRKPVRILEAESMPTLREARLCGWHRL
jgi:hypothetical protein